jgi:hypothetical protein
LSKAVTRLLTYAHDECVVCEVEPVCNMSAALHVNGPAAATGARFAGAAACSAGHSPRAITMPPIASDQPRPCNLRIAVFLQRQLWRQA